MDGIGDHDVKWNKPGPQQEVSHVFSEVRGEKVTTKTKNKVMKIEELERWKRKGKGWMKEWIKSKYMVCLYGNVIMKPCIWIINVH
jgi:hypothetical protein